MSEPLSEEKTEPTFITPDEAAAALLKAQEAVDTLRPTRARSLVITKLEEAQLWLTKCPAEPPAAA